MTAIIFKFSSVYIVVICLLHSALCFSQEPPILFHDRFDDNVNDWDNDSSSNVLMKIVEGKYLFINRTTEGKWWSTKRISIDQERDFDISASIEHKFGSPVDMYGLIWGKKNNNRFEFSITKAGYFHITQREKGKTIYLKELSYSASIHIGNDEVNQLKVSKKDGYYQFYINDSIVHRMKFKKFFGDYVGFTIKGSKGITIDDFMIKGFRTYRSIDLHEQHEIFREDFNNNFNGWPVSDSTKKIENGHYAVSNFQNNSAVYYLLPVSLDSDKDFHVEIVTRKIRNTKDSGYGLIWRMGSNVYKFLISPDGYFLIYIESDRRVKTLKKWTYCEEINTESYSRNKLHIIKHKATLYYFVNNELVFEERYVNNSPISEIGFIVGANLSIAIDYFRITNERIDDLSPRVECFNKVLILNEDFGNVNSNFIESVSTYTEGDHTPLSKIGDAIDSDSIWYVLGNYPINGMTYNGAVKNNSFIFNNKVLEDMFLLHMAPIDSSRNFIVEAEVEVFLNTDEASASFSLVWGNSKDENFGMISVDQGYFSAWHIVNQNEVMLSDWQSTGKINQGIPAVNKISILKLDQTYYCFINHSLIFTTKSINLGIREIGFRVGELEQLTIHYLRAFYLEK